MRPATPFELRLIVNMTNEQLDAAVDVMFDIERLWTPEEHRAAILFLNEHTRRLMSGPVPSVPGASIGFL